MAVSHYFLVVQRLSSSRLSPVAQQVRSAFDSINLHFSLFIPVWSKHNGHCPSCLGACSAFFLISYTWLKHFRGAAHSDITSKAEWGRKEPSSVHVWAWTSGELQHTLTSVCSRNEMIQESKPCIKTCKVHVQMHEPHYSTLKHHLTPVFNIVTVFEIRKVESQVFTFTALTPAQGIDYTQQRAKCMTKSCVFVKWKCSMCQFILQILQIQHNEVFGPKSANFASQLRISPAEVSVSSMSQLSTHGHPRRKWPRPFVAAVLWISSDRQMGDLCSLFTQTVDSSHLARFIPSE